MAYKYNEVKGEFEDVPATPQTPKTSPTTPDPWRTPVSSSDSLFKLIVQGIKMILSNTVIIN